MCVSRGWGTEGLHPGHLEDHKLLYVSLEILLLTTSRRSRTPWVQMLWKGGQVRTALCEKTKIEFSGHPTPPDRIFWILPCIINIQTLLSASNTVALYQGHLYVFFETPKKSMRWIDGVGVAQHIWRDFTWISESWAWQGRVGAFGLFVCLFWLAWPDSLRPSQQSFGLVGMGLPGWIQ